MKYHAQTFCCYLALNWQNMLTRVFCSDNTKHYWSSDLSPTFLISSLIIYRGVDRRRFLIIILYPLLSFSVLLSPLLMRSIKSFYLSKVFMSTFNYSLDINHFLIIATVSDINSLLSWIPHTFIGGNLMTSISKSGVLWSLVTCTGSPDLTRSLFVVLKIGLFYQSRGIFLTLAV